MDSRRAPKKTAFVPKIIFQTASVTAVGVIPLCVMACGGIAVGPAPDAGPDIEYTVACVSCGVADAAFDAIRVGVAAACFEDGGCSTDANTSDVEFFVAACAFPDGGACDIDDAGGDVLLGVAAMVFDASSKG
jgi:hypothetical protein